MAYSIKAVFRDSRSMNEHDDCAVKALALSTALSYSDAHALLKKHGRKNRAGTGFQAITRPAFREAGYALIDVTSKIEAKTVRTFSRLNLPMSSNYVIRTARHILAARSNVVLDWTDGRMHRIIEVYKVVKIT